MYGALFNDILIVSCDTGTSTTTKRRNAYLATVMRNQDFGFLENAAKYSSGQQVKLDTLATAKIETRTLRLN